jgi:hypothetical protein
MGARTTVGRLTRRTELDPAMKRKHPLAYRIRAFHRSRRVGERHPGIAHGRSTLIDLDGSQGPHYQCLRAGADRGKASLADRKRGTDYCDWR